MGQETDTDPQIISKVSDSSGGSSTSKMIVEPSQEDILRWKLQKARHVLSILKKDNELREVFEGNLREKLNLNDLPQETQDQDGTRMK
jgi:hypothetical protein